ncbi:MAG: crossover junction endodeoxyribonuclease RuvC [Actinomycetes bacterium]
MRVLGVDPGLTRCGLGVVDGQRGRAAALVAVDVVRTPSAADLQQRLLVIAERLDAWLDRHAPDVVAVERVFSQNNVRTVMGTAQVSGVAVLAAARRAIPVALHTPSEVKAAVTGNGRADKAQVTTMVTRILDLPERPSPADAADALALALCHLWRGAPAGSLVTASGAPTPAQAAWAQAARQARSRSNRGFAVPDARPGAEPGSLPVRRVTTVRRPG